MTNNFFKNKKGFTIVETLVAVAILMISVAGPLVIAQKGLMSAVLAKNQTIASFLAQDMMESIKNIRDNNIIDGKLWHSIYEGCIANMICYLNTNTVVPEGTGSPNLFISPEGYYSSNFSYTNTPFRRYFSYKRVNVDDNEYEYTVTVEWNQGNIKHSVVLTDHLFNVKL